MLARLWANNKKFILVAGAGFTLFLFLNSCVSDFAFERPKAIGAEAARLARDVRRLHKEVGRYREVQARLEAYAKEEEELRAALEPPPEKEIQAFEEGSPLLQFEQALDRMWENALEKANRSGAALPEKLDPRDFGVRREDGRAEYERHYAYLGIARRSMEALIEAGIRDIEDLDLVEPDVLPVLPRDDSLYCLFRAVRVRATGSFDSFIRTLEDVQEPGAFLQVRIRSLQAEDEDGGEAVRGELDFVAFRLLDASGLDRAGVRIRR